MNSWEVVLSRDSLKFLRKNHFSETMVTEAIAVAIKKISGDKINADLKKLHSPYEGYFRMHIGRVRIVFSVDFDLRSVDVIEVNWRGSSYRS